MSLFGSILEKLGLRKPASPPPATAQAPRPPSDARVAAPAAPPAAAPVPPPPPKPQPMAEVDVVAKLEQLAAANPQKLNWRTSIVDLMKLLGMESSLAERKELAAELGYPKDEMGDSAKMNVWLHKQVLRRIAENGGNVPKELLD
jgi:type IV secretory pathway VirB10-like protein